LRVKTKSTPAYWPELYSGYWKCVQWPARHLFPTNKIYKRTKTIIRLSLQLDSDSNCGPRRHVPSKKILNMFYPFVSASKLIEVFTAVFLKDDSRRGFSFEIENLYFVRFQRNLQALRTLYASSIRKNYIAVTP
jgi:hypothetical protein